MPDSFLDYVKVWMNNVDRGGLSHASNDAYTDFCCFGNCFLPNKLLKSGEPKSMIIDGIMTNAEVLSLWEVATDLPEPEESRQSSLLLFAFALGFLIANNLLEQYKKGTALLLQCVAM